MATQTDENSVNKVHNRTVDISYRSGIYIICHMKKVSVEENRLPSGLF